MNKSAIRNYAVWARKRLIEDIAQKAFELGITEGNIEDAIRISSDTVMIKDISLTGHEIKQRESLVQRIKEKGFKEIIEEVAYTWFNRFIAIRFMEVNEYLPTGVRVLSSVEPGKNEPDIIKQFENIDLGLGSDDFKLIHDMLDANDTENLYKYLLIKQCNKLNEILPVLFEEIEDYTEILLPSNLLQDSSVIRKLVQDISEDDFKEQVEIIGWMYQYYILEKKDEVFEGLKKNIKISKENIPAATQLFTPDWIVKYMVENSLGRLWLEGHPNQELKTTWKYYLEEAEQEIEVQKKLEGTKVKSKNLRPEDIKIFDPCMGSGHILVYAFDVLYEIYKNTGYSENDIPRLILENNLYGLDIDDRAAQLAYFAVMMKARGKSRRIFRDKVNLNICSIRESNEFSKEAINFFVNPNNTKLEKMIQKEDIEYLIELFKEAKIYGSIIKVKDIDFNIIERRIYEIEQIELQDIFELQYRNIILDKMPSIIKQAKIINNKYDVVCTNPPYMGRKGMSDKLVKYVDSNFPDSSSDLFAVFIERGFEWTKLGGFNSMVTMQSWMFLSSFENMRSKLIENKSIVTLTHMDNMVMGIAFGTVATVFRNSILPSYRGTYCYISLKDIDDNNLPRSFPIKNNKFNIVSIDMFKNVPNYSITYWFTEKDIEIFKHSNKLGAYGKSCKGIDTGNNNKFLRMWYEVDSNKIGLGFKTFKDAKESMYKWYPYNKGGSYRKWYGNNEYIINWENDGFELRNFPNSNLRNKDYYFKQGITWSTVTSGSFSSRKFGFGYLFDNGGSCFFSDNKNINYFLGILNSKIFFLVDSLSPTVNYQPGDIGRLPIIETTTENECLIVDIVDKNILISKDDWDSFENSWDFLKHPLLVCKNDKKNIQQAYNKWSDLSNERFEHLKENEERLNRLLIEIYDLQNEITSEVEGKNITIRKSDRIRDIKSFLSYAIGCIFGRYSIDTEGLVYAGGDWRDKWAVDNGQWKVRKQTKDEENKIIGEGWSDVSFAPDEDNVIPILDDEYFEDDILGKFIEFVKVTFGESTLEENLDYIAETLGKKSSETSRQTIRRYFLKDFYKDHIQTYQKKPIYWLFDSGKEDGFKALIYMHRYDEYTVAKVRTDYLHKLQKKYDAEIKRIEIILDSNVSEKEKANARKKKEKIQKQMQECLQYDQIIAHIANQRISIDLDDGVTANYEKFQGIEVPQGEGKKPLKANLLAKL